MRGIYSLTALVVSGLALLSSAVVDAKSATGGRVLVLLDSLAEKDSYSQFWQQLEGKCNITVSIRVVAHAICARSPVPALVQRGTRPFYYIELLW